MSDFFFGDCALPWFNFMDLSFICLGLCFESHLFTRLGTHSYNAIPSCVPQYWLSFLTFWFHMKEFFSHSRFLVLALPSSIFCFAFLFLVPAQKKFSVPYIPFFECAKICHYTPRYCPAIRPVNRSFDVSCIILVVLLLYPVSLYPVLLGLELSLCPFVS